MLDYIVVGFGLAGMSFAEQLRRQNKTFVVITEEKHSSSIVAGGMYNPVILKRFTSPWNALPQLEYAIPFYKAIEKRLTVEVLNPLPVLRVFNSIEEQNNWLIASDKPTLTPFLSPKFVLNTYEHISAEHNFGEVTKAGRLQVAKLLCAYKENLEASDQYIHEAFNHQELTVNEASIFYKDIEARNIVFAEGYGMMSNPYFNYLPLNGTKGEVLIIKSEELQVDAIVKSGAFIIPLVEENHYLVGATYHWTDKSWETTQDAKEELINKLTEFVTSDFEVVNQFAGIRPTVKDRRPLVGQHPLHENMYVLNGLGTRGVMVAPMVSKQLFDYIENDVPLDTEIDILRFATVK